jgi:hypothetical protein
MANIASTITIAKFSQYYSEKNPALRNFGEFFYVYTSVSLVLYIIG